MVVIVAKLSKVVFVAGSEANKFKLFIVFVLDASVSFALVIRDGMASVVLLSE